MRLCALDVESTGTVPGKDFITEVGYVIWEVGVTKPYRLNSEIVTIPAEVEITNTIFKLTGVTRNHTNSGVSIENVVENLHDELDYWDVEAMVAHNAPFDKSMMEAAGFREMNWLCTMRDIEYCPITFKSKSLTFIAGTLGFVNMYPHSALFDAVTCKRVMDHYDVEQIVRNSKIPSIFIKAKTVAPKYDGGESKDKAKSLGYRYDGNTYTWWKEIKENEYPVELAKADEICLSIEIFEGL